MVSDLVCRLVYDVYRVLVLHIIIYLDNIQSVTQSAVPRDESNRPVVVSLMERTEPEGRYLTPITYGCNIVRVKVFHT